MIPSIAVNSVFCQVPSEAWLDIGSSPGLPSEGRIGRKSMKSELDGGGKKEKEREEKEEEEEMARGVG